MYGPQLIKLVEAQLAPQAICGALGLCAGYDKTIPARCQQPKLIGMCRALISCKFFFRVLFLDLITLALQELYISNKIVNFFCETFCF